jgi:hypothetical protein
VFRFKGFRLKFIGINTTFSRFGRGLYFAPNSSKSNDYTDGDTRAMFLCKVAAGREYVVYNDMRNLEKPPSGYDSVYGEVGQALNYPGIG